MKTAAMLALAGFDAATAYQMPMLAQRTSTVSSIRMQEVATPPPPEAAAPPPLPKIQVRARAKITLARSHTRTHTRPVLTPVRYAPLRRRSWSAMARLLVT